MIVRKYLILLISVAVLKSCSTNPNTVTVKPILLPEARSIIEIKKRNDLNSYIRAGICEFISSDTVSYAGWTTYDNDKRMSKILIRNNISKTDGTHFFISKTQSRSHGDFLRDALFVNYSIYYCLNEKEFSKIIINLKITLKKLLYYKGYINDTIDNELKDAVYNFLVDEGLYNEFEDISFNKIISNKVFNESIEKANTRVN